ncbi:hypothetical protein D9M68_404290 [compost metagenome]
MLQPVRQIRVGDEGPAEADQVGPAVGQRLFRALLGVGAGIDQRAAIDDAQRLLERRRHHRRVFPVGLGDVDVGHADLVQQPGRGQVGRLGRVVHRALQGGERRQAHADAVFADHRGHRLGDFAEEAQAVGQRAAVPVGAVVGLGIDELVDQVAVGAMQFDPVETGVQRIARGLGVVADDAVDLLHAQCARRRVLDHLADAVLRPAPLDIDEHLHAFRDLGRGRYRRGIARLQRGVRHAADMPELGEDAPAGGMHGVGDLAPAGDLFGAMDARRPGIALALAADLGAFGNDQPGAGALGVVLGHQLGGDIAGAGPRAGHRRHHDAVGGFDPAECIGGEQHGNSLQWMWDERIIPSGIRAKNRLWSK